MPIARSSRNIACHSRSCSILTRRSRTAYGAANGIAKYGLDGRVTYVIGGDGKILKVYPKVDPALNASEIISQFDNK
jgi:peroxiredoxin